MVRSPGSGFLRSFFLEQNRELGSPKSEKIYQESKITRRNLILSFFSLINGFHWKSISKSTQSFSFCFFKFWNETSNKIAWIWKTGSKSVGFPMKIHLLKEKLPPGPSSWTAGCRCALRNWQHNWSSRVAPLIRMRHDREFPFCFFCAWQVCGILRYSPCRCDLQEGDLRCL